MAAADRKRCAASSVKVRLLSKAYREKTVLADLSFSLEAGQIYCLMGTSGIGKTTLLRILMGLETPDKGSAVPEIRPESAISAVFQENRLLGYDRPYQKNHRRKQHGLDGKAKIHPVRI